MTKNEYQKLVDELEEKVSVLEGEKEVLEGEKEALMAELEEAKKEDAPVEPVAVEPPDIPLHVLNKMARRTPLA